MDYSKLIDKRESYENLVWKVLLQAIKDLGDKWKNNRKSAIYFFESGDYKYWCKLINLDAKSFYDYYKKNNRRK